ncbi:DNA-binding domain-containing protein [Variovorax sp. YR216]|uniref:HvfC/BufC N-terminal domain-containing protein n=1 Tax=Variovorax sp. YR216 TaxID=1882828 RepID=UPI0008994443|nr:DNA-binding domain-containing protein [Variovorax sp. YR216]SEA07462.1 Putative DNA-binding domain-containing protein [Variovorax sp. YR216]
MTSGLSRFQSAFASALHAPDDIADPAMHALLAQPAFAVYRNTVMKGCVDALEANFPAVARLVGSEWFRAAAALHVADQPPRDGQLSRYGGAFPDFLSGFEPASGLTYLADVARIDAMWSEAHVAADAAPVDAAWLARQEPDTLARLVLVPHPAARWAWFRDQPIFSIWQRNRAEGDAAGIAHLDWRSEGALITRPRDAVRSCAIGEADCAFLDACATGLPLAEAAERASDANPEADLAALLEGLLRAGAFARPSPQPDLEVRTP